MDVVFMHGNEPDALRLLRRLALKGATRAADAAGSGAVIRWGTFAEEPGRIFTLNPLRNVVRALHQPAVRDILEIHGIRAAIAGAALRPGERPSRHQPDGKYAREYMIPVFHLEPLAVWEKVRPAQWLPAESARKAAYGPLQWRPGSGEAEYRELDPAAKSFHAMRAVRQAVRAVYALGLDLAVVRVGITPEGRTTVAGVDPVPVLNERLTELFAEAMHRFAREWEAECARSRPASLGADPEFLLRRPDGGVVPASRYMEREGRVGCDAIVLPGGKTLLPLGELRPAPSADPLQLVRHIRETMREAARLISDDELIWTAGGMPVKGLPLGGHIHFGGGAMPNSRLLRALDNYLTLPLIMLESAADRKRRPRYGFLGDFRRKAHGGFEYRTPPSWLGSPQLATGVLCLARLIADQYRSLPDDPLYHRDVQRYYYNGDKSKVLPIVLELWRTLESVPGYALYEKELAWLKESLVSARAEAEETGSVADMRKAWEIRIPEKGRSQLHPPYLAFAHPDFML